MRNGTDPCAARVRQLLDMARDYTGLSWAQLAPLLKRTRGQLFEINGKPKLDFLGELARVLDWPIGAVAEDIWEARTCRPPSDDGADFATLDQASKAARRNGQYHCAVELARRMYALADGPEQRARACNREAASWEGLGHYCKQLDGLRLGLEEVGISTGLRLMLEANLANAYYSLWLLLEGCGVAERVIESLDANPPSTRRERVVQAFACYVRGNIHRRLLARVPEHGPRHCLRAKEDLERALRLYEGLYDEFRDESYAGIANTLRGGIMEVDVELGVGEPWGAIRELCHDLDAVVDPEAIPAGDWLESCGWRCIFGCNIAFRHLSEIDLQRPVATFTGKALDIAERLGNWALRERALSLEYGRRQKLAHLTGTADDSWILDQDDRRLICGTMGRFPMFRPIGWKILEGSRRAV